MQAKYEESMRYAKAALELRRELLGPRHLDVADGMDCVSYVHWMRGDNDEATTLLRDALSIKLEKLGDGLDAAYSYNCLGLTLGHSDQAIAYYNRSLRTRKAELGEQHPAYAQAVNNLGCCFEDRGELDLALKYYSEAMAIRAKKSKVLPDYAQSLGNVASVYDALGRFDEALELYDEAVAIRADKLGKDHPFVAALYYGMALTYNNKEDFVKAVEAYQAALRIYQHAENDTADLGGNAADCLHNMAICFYRMGNFERALAHYEEALGMFRSILGERHEAIASTLSNIALVFSGMQLQQDAIACYMEAADIYAEACGPRSKQIAGVYASLGVMHNRLGDAHKSTAFFEKCHDIRAEVLGPEHIETISAQESIIRLLRLQLASKLEIR